MSGHLYAFFLLLKPDKGVCYGELFHSSRRRRLLVGFSPHLIHAAKCRQVGISFINQRLGRVLPDVLGCLPLPKKNGWPRMQLGRGMVHVAGRVAGGRERKRERQKSPKTPLWVSPLRLRPSAWRKPISSRDQQSRGPCLSHLPSQLCMFLLPLLSLPAWDSSGRSYSGGATWWWT